MTQTSVDYERMFIAFNRGQKIINQVLESPELRKNALQALHDISLRKSALTNPAGYFRKTMGI